MTRDDVPDAYYPVDPANAFRVHEPRIGESAASLFPLSDSADPRADVSRTVNGCGRWYRLEESVAHVTDGRLDGLVVWELPRLLREKLLLQVVGRPSGVDVGLVSASAQTYGCGAVADRAVDVGRDDGVGVGGVL